MNPFLKTLVTLLAGTAAATADSIISGTPTGGMAQYLAANPSIAIAFVAVQQLAHNLLSHYAPPGVNTTATVIVAPGDPRA